MGVGQGGRRKEGLVGCSSGRCISRGGNVMTDEMPVKEDTGAAVNAQQDKTNDKRRGG